MDIWFHCIFCCYYVSSFSGRSSQNKDGKNFWSVKILKYRSNHCVFQRFSVSKLNLTLWSFNSLTVFIDMATNSMEKLWFVTNISNLSDFGFNIQSCNLDKVDNFEVPKMWIFLREMTIFVLIYLYDGKNTKIESLNFPVKLQCLFWS